MRSSRWLSCAMLLLAGCTAGARLAPIDARHPASPDGPEGVIAEPAAMLREEAVQTPAVEVPAGGHAHHHHGGETPR